jgi:hypothetical protein
MSCQQRFSVMMCSNSRCQGTEAGCKSDQCIRPGWGINLHEEFFRKHDRCPAQCANPDFVREEVADTRGTVVDEEQLEFKL